MKVVGICFCRPLEGYVKDPSCLHCRDKIQVRDYDALSCTFKARPKLPKCAAMNGAKNTTGQLGSNPWNCSANHFVYLIVTIKYILFSLMKNHHTNSVPFGAPRCFATQRSAQRLRVSSYGSGETLFLKQEPLENIATRL